MAQPTFPIIIEEIRDLTSNVRHLGCRLATGENINFIPGQFISLHLNHTETLVRRSYSIASIPGQSDLLEFALSYVKGGIASEFLFNLNIGATLECSGPYGRLILRDEPMQRCFLISTGTGVTPYRAMLPQIADKLAANASLQIYVLEGIQYQADQLYSADFLALMAKQPRFHYRVYHSRDTLITANSYEFKGYVQNAFDELTPDPATDIVYLCGNPNMIDNAYDILKETGFSAQQVRREKYVS